MTGDVILKTNTMAPLVVRKTLLVVLPAHSVGDTSAGSDNDWCSGTVGVKRKCCAAAEGLDCAAVSPHYEVEMETVVLNRCPPGLGTAAGDLVVATLLVEGALVVDSWAHSHCGAISEPDDVALVEGALVINGRADGHCCAIGELDGLCVLRGWGCDCKSSKEDGEELMIKHGCLYRSSDEVL